MQISLEDLMFTNGNTLYVCLESQIESSMSLDTQLSYTIQLGMQFLETVNMAFHAVNDRMAWQLKPAPPDGASL